MTPEQREALNTAIEGWIFEPIIGSMVERVFLAGMRYQHERTREAAAKVCEGTVKREPEYGGRWGGYGSFDGPMTAKECVEAIRALTLDEC